MKISGSLKLLIAAFLLLFLQCSFAQKTRVVKILDSNLFELSDGRVVKMAGVDAPGKNYPGRILSLFSKKIVEYSKTTLKGREFEIVPASYDTTDFQLVYILKHYPLGTEDVNKSFLAIGFGKFADNVDSLHREAYLNAEKDAAENNMGLWRYRAYGMNDTLDRKYSEAERKQIMDSDTMHVRLVRNKMKTPPPAKVFTECLAGAGAGFGGMLLFGYIGASAGGNDIGESLGGALVGGFFGYVVTSTLAVYLIASDDNPEVTYLGTLGCGLAGAFIGVGVGTLASHDSFVPFFLAPMVVSLIGSVTYANSVKEPPDMPLEIDSYRQEFSKCGSIAFKDYRNRESININLVHISF